MSASGVYSRVDVSGTLTAQCRILSPATQPERWGAGTPSPTPQYVSSPNCTIYVTNLDDNPLNHGGDLAQVVVEGRVEYYLVVFNTSGNTAQIELTVEAGIQ